MVQLHNVEDHAMSLRKAVLAVAVTAGLAASVGAAAQGYTHADRQGLAQVLGAVQLSSDQQQQVHGIMSAARTQSAPQRARMQALQQQIDSALLSSGATEAQILPLLQQQESLRQQLDVSRIETALAIRNVMTSTQLAKAASVQAQLAALHQQEHAVARPGQ